MKAFESFFEPVDNTISYDPEQLAMGVKVESEHTPYKSIATIIAKQHLAEDPEYYIKLQTVEGNVSPTNIGSEVK